MKKFTQWLFEKYDYLITESSGTPYDGVKKDYPDVIKFINDEIGEFVLETEISINKNYNGLFLKNTGNSSKNNMCVVNASDAHQKLINLTQTTDIVKKDGTEFIIKCDLTGETKNSKTITIHTSNKIKANQNIEDINVDKYFVFKNDIQEAIQASLLEMKAHHETIIVKNKPYPKYSDLYNWLITSDPIKHTGICKYLTFNVPVDDVETWRTEFISFLDKSNGAWRKCFDGIWNSDIISLIGSAFVKPITNWSGVEFLHTFKKSNSAITESIKNYLTGNRCGKQKDLIDKSDIIMCVNKSAYKYIDEVVDTLIVEQHNALLNELINEKELIGISLKQNNGNANLSAINFKISTTAIGDNIKDNVKSLIKYYGPDDKNNTIGKMEFPKNNKSATTLIKIKLQHPEDLHLSENEIILNMRPSTNKKAFKIEFSSKSNAQFGKGAEVLKNFDKIKNTKNINLNFNSINGTAIYQKFLMKYNNDYVKASIETAKFIFKNLNDNPEKIVYLFGEAASYPIMMVNDEEKTYKLTGAPYFKIY